MKKNLLFFIFYFILFFAKANRIVSNAIVNSFTSTTTWVGGVVPGANDTAIISAGSSLYLNYTSSLVRALVIKPNAALSMLSGTFNITDSLNNQGTFLAQSTSTVNIGGLPNAGVNNSGYMLIDYGTTLLLGTGTGINNCKFISSDSLVINPSTTVNINGSFNITAAFVQNGGSISVNGYGSTAANSVPEASNVIYIDATHANCSAGSITIVNPHYTTFFPFVNEVQIDGNNLTAFYGTHTFYIGDGSSTKPGPTNRGFNFGNGTANGSKAPIQNLVVQSGNGYEREFRTSIIAGTGTYIKGDVTVQNNSDFQHIWVHEPECAIGGNITVQSGSYFTSSRVVTLGGLGYTMANAQTLSGAGSFRNDYNAQTNTGNFAKLRINNMNTGNAVTWTYDTLLISTSLELANGDLYPKTWVEIGRNAISDSKIILGNGGIIKNTVNNTGMRRWYQKAYTPTVSLNTDYSGFPWKYNGKSYLAQWAGTMTADGFVATVLNYAEGSSPIPSAYQGIDNGVYVDTRSNTNVDVGYGGGFGSTNISLQFTGTGSSFLLNETTTGNLRIYRNVFAPTPIITNTPSGTVDAPIVTSSGIPAETSMWGLHYFAGNNSNLLTYIPSKQSGFFTDTATWRFNRIPDQVYGADVKNGHTVTTNDVAARLIRNLFVEAGGNFVLANTGGIALVPLEKTRIWGNYTQNSGHLFPMGSNTDTAFASYSGSVITQNSVDFLWTKSLLAQSTLRNDFCYIAGTLNLNKGYMQVSGSIQFDGMANLNIKKGATLVIYPNTGASSSSANRTLIDFKTEGNVMTDGGTITITDPPINAVSTIAINRNTNATGFDIRKTKINFRVNDGIGGTFAGLATTGFTVDTKVGSINEPLGMVQVNSPTNNYQFVKNGTGGLFIWDTLNVVGEIRFDNTSNQNYLAGNVVNSGAITASGNLRFGGSSVFPTSTSTKQYISGGGAFRNAVTGSTASFANVEINTNGSVFFRTNAYSVSSILNLEKGVLQLENILTLGTSAVSPGSLTVNKGRLVCPSGGSIVGFKRWFGTNTISFSDLDGLFPFMRNGADYLINVAGTPSTGGTILFNCYYIGAGSVAFSPSYTDAGVTVSSGYNSSVTMLAADGYANSNLGLQVNNPLLQTANVADLRISTATGTLFAGIHGNAYTGANGPVVTRANIPFNAGTSYSFLLGGPSAENYAIINSVASGDWENKSTWDCACIPNASNNINVNATHTVTVNSSANYLKKASQITLNNNGALNIAGDSLQVQNIFSGTGSTLTINGGTLLSECLGVFDSWAGKIDIQNGKMIEGYNSVSDGWVRHNCAMQMVTGAEFDMENGRLEINGLWNILASSKVNMTGGKVVIDGAGGNDFSAISNPFLYVVDAAAPYSKTFSGGTIVIRNPKNGGYYSLYNGALSSGSTLSYQGSTMIFGAESENEPNLYSNFNGAGFAINQDYGQLGNVVAKGNFANGRHVYFGSPKLDIKGDLTIDSTGEFVIPSNATSKIIVGGNLSNNGIFTSANGELVMGGDDYAISAAQTISGTGKWRSLVTDATTSGYLPYVYKFTINNLGTTGVALNIDSLYVGNTFTLNNGDLTVPSATKLYCGVSSQTPGTLVANGTGGIVGKVNAWVNSATTALQMPVGYAGTREQATINFTTPVTTGGMLTAEFIKQQAPNLTYGLPLTEPVGNINITQASSYGYWRIIASQGLAGGVYDVTFNAKNFPGVTDPSKLVLLKRSTSALPWALNGTHTTTTGSITNAVLKRTGMSGFSEFIIGSDNSSILPLQLLSFGGSIQDNKSQLQWNTADESNTYQFKLQWSTDGSHFSTIQTVAAAGSGNNTYNGVHTAPVIGANYYRLLMVDKDNSSSYSKTILLQNNKAASIALYPNPASSIVNISSSRLIDEVLIYDMLGKLILNKNVAAYQTSINVQNLPRGNYMVKYSIDKTWMTDKLSLQ